MYTPLVILYAINTHYIYDYLLSFSLSMHRLPLVLITYRMKSPYTTSYHVKLFINHR